VRVYIIVTVGATAGFLPANREIRHEKKTAVPKAIPKRRCMSIRGRVFVFIRDGARRFGTLL